MGGNHKNLEALPGDHATACYNKNEINVVANLAGRIYNQLQHAKRPDQKCVVAVRKGAFNIKSSWPFPTPGCINYMYTLGNWSRVWNVWLLTIWTIYTLPIIIHLVNKKSKQEERMSELFVSSSDLQCSVTSCDIRALINWNCHIRVVTALITHAC